MTGSLMQSLSMKIRLRSGTEGCGCLNVSWSSPLDMIKPTPLVSDSRLDVPEPPWFCAEASPFASNPRMISLEDPGRRSLRVEAERDGFCEEYGRSMVPLPSEAMGESKASDLLATI